MSAYLPLNERVASLDAESAQNLDGRRTAPWLLSPYSSDKWIVTDTLDPSRRKTIAFRYRMADGRCLTEVGSLYRTVKEYAWWVRVPAIGGMEDAKTQQSKVLGLMAVAHSMSMKGIWSFADLDRFIIDDLVERISFGVDALLDAHERVTRYLDELEQVHLRDPKADRGLPRYVTPTGVWTNKVAGRQILAACNLPDSASTLTRVAWPIAAASNRAGLRHEVDLSIECPAPAVVTSIAMLRFLSPIEQLYDWRHRVEADSPLIRPFDQGAQKVSEAKGARTQRTPTPPPSLALKLLEQAATWVIEYAPLLLDAERRALQLRGKERSRRHRELDAIERTLPRSGAAGCPWPCYMRRHSTFDVFHFYDAIKFLSVACWIVVATFSARRIEEMLDLEPDCIRGNESEGWWLHVYIAKTLQRKEWIPVPSLVAAAINVMIGLSEPARKFTGTQKIFQWLDPFTGEDDALPIALSPQGNLSEFAAHVSIPEHATEQGELKIWHWTSHQLRRFFAILYFYRYEGAQLEVLSHHLRHFNLEMTRVYVTKDPDVRALWLDTEWGYQGDLVRAIVAGERRISGGMGERLTKTARRLVALFRSRLQVVTSEKISTALKLILKRKGVVLSPKPWVTCTCPATERAAASARCRGGALSEGVVSGPDFSNAGPDVCSKCPWAYIDESKEFFYRQELSFLRQSVAAVGPDTVVASLQAARIADIEWLGLKECDEGRSSDNLERKEIGG